jgi:hypothetical protein
MHDFTRWYVVNADTAFPKMQPSCARDDEHRLVTKVLKGHGIAAQTESLLSDLASSGSMQQ